jgi:AmpE protein
MLFLSVLLAYVLSRYTAVCAWLHHDGWLNSAIDALALRKPATFLPFAGTVIAGTLLVAVGLWYLPFWLGFLGGIVVLLFSLGRGDWRSNTAQTLMQLRDGNAEAVWLTLESEQMLDASTQPDTLWRALRKQAAYRYLLDLFAVFFWFVLLGPAAAVFFRLLVVYNRHAHVRDGRLPSCQQWQTVLEWLPARYMALCFCLSGNFIPSFNLWRQLALDTHLGSADFLARCMDAALILDESITAEAAGVDVPEPVAVALRRGQSLQDLLVHTEMIGLVGLALTVLVLH